MPSKFKFEDVKKRVQQAQTELPKLMANDARNYFLDNFERQGSEGKPWKEVQRRTPGTPAYRWPRPPKASSQTNPILIRTGNLRRKVRNSIRDVSWSLIRLVVDLPYAKRHNEGLDGMPARPFMTNTPGLRLKLTNRIKSYMKKLWQTRID